MSTTPIYTTFCDAGAEPEYPRADGCVWWIAQKETKAASRKIAAEEGWVLGSRGLPDFCPACVPSQWCPTCGSRGKDWCLTASGRDHRARRLR